MNEFEISEILTRKKKIYIVILVLTTLVWIYLYNYHPSSFIEVKAQVEDYGRKMPASRGNYELYTDLSYEYKGDRFLIKTHNEFRFGWSRGDIVTIYINPFNPSDIYSSRDSRTITIFSGVILCFVVSKILVEKEKWRRKKNPNWFEEDKEKYEKKL